MVVFLFFCSGATALVYEVIWSKYLSLMFGSTVYAQTTVLAVFMGGLALGNRIFGGRSDLLKKPLATYGYIEIAIGLYAFLFTWIYGAADALFVTLGSPFVHDRYVLLLLKGFFSILLLLGPTVLMGGTLPLIAAWLQKSPGDAGRKSARFYAVNSLGAVFGAFMAGFILVQWMGLQSTLEMTALINVLIGACAIVIARNKSDFPAMVGVAETSHQPAITPEQKQLLLRGSCLVAVTGAVSMGLEILSARSLSLLFGASLQAFAVVLIAFILGIGIGSAVVSSTRFKSLKTENLVFAALLLAAFWIGLFIFNIEPLFEFYRHLKSGLAPSNMGYRYQQVLTALVSIVVLGIPAALLGSVLPLWIRNVAQNTFTLGNHVGRLLTWNTCGAVVGVLVTGFVLMPLVGLRAAYACLAILLGVVAFAMAFQKFSFAKVLAAGAVLIFSAIAGSTGGDHWQYIMSSGVFRIREMEVGTPIRERMKYTRLLFYEDAPDATVSVEAMVANTNNLNLRINGKPDASSEGDLSTQYLLAHIPMAVKPDSKDVFVLGFGSGMTAGALLSHPVENIVVAENCAPVLRAGKFFERWNNGILTNSRAKIRQEDARTILKLSPQKYDAIICEPSNPWTAGVGSIFTKEFYNIAASRLKDDGVICQWFHVYEMHDGIVFLVLRTFGSVFPFYEIWETGQGDILMLGALKPFKSDASVYGKIFEREAPRTQLAAIGIHNPESLWARQMASQETAFAIPGNGPVQTDLFPILEYEAPKAFYLGKSSTRLFTFDERTWQTDIASAGKTKALKSLDIDQLDQIFAGHASANAELVRFLKWYSQTGRWETNAWKEASFPVIFRPANVPAPQLVPGNNESIGMQTLLEGNALLLNNQISAGLEKVEAALQSSRLEPNSGFEHATANAVRKCLANKQLERAQALLQKALDTHPTSDQLNYLFRLIGKPEAPEIAARE
ncbi:MAG: fused MFS/spermidine synthase [Verrucomicrobia bacterium]|nr:fused MFS/spermidine synthase [Verrucomicrobiota bacterium]